MIAIPNIKKPESCKECIDRMLNVIVDCYPDSYGEDKDGNKVVCPIIDIVQCGECEYYAESKFTKGNMACEYHIGETYYTEADRFCCHGERRTDGHI